MAKKQFEVTITPEPFTVTVEASKPAGAINKAHRQWRDEVAKNVDKLDIVANRIGGKVEAADEVAAEEPAEDPAVEDKE